LPMRDAAVRPSLKKLREKSRLVAVAPLQMNQDMIAEGARL